MTYGDSLIQKAKRKLSVSLPKAIFSNSNSSKADDQRDDERAPKAESLKPYGYRENTALHAIFDTFAASSLTPSLPTFHLPTSCFTAELDDDVEDDAPAGQEDPLKLLSGNVLALGGYRGSILRDAKTNKRLWLPVRTGLRIRKPVLELGLTDEDEARSEETIVPGHMLMAVIGFVDLGKRLKDKLKASPTARWHSWGYDWRRRPELSSALLLAELTKLKEESAARGENEGKGFGAVVAAHSLGGLVALHALSKAADPTVLRAIIFAGTPFKGCLNVLGPLRRGDGVLLNRDLCSPAVTFSMRSSFYLLPRDSKGFELPTGEPVPVDFLDERSWIEHNFSPVVTAVLGVNKSKFERQEAALQSQRADNVGMPSMTIDKEAVEPVLNPSSSSAPRDQPRQSGNGNGPEQDEGEVPMPRIEFEQNEVSPPDTPPLASSDEEEAEDDQPMSPLDDNARVVRDYLRTTLERAQVFHREIVEGYDPAKKHLYPPMTLLVSSKTPTVRACMTPSRQDIASIVYEGNLLWGKGDGIVTHDSSSRMPGQWHDHVKGVVESGLGHISLLGDLKSVRKCLDLMQAY